MVGMVIREIFSGNRRRKHMTVWVKEYGNTVTIEKIRYWIKKEIDVRKLEDISSIEVTDIVIFSRADNSLSKEELVCNILVYEDLYEKIAISVFQEHQYNYDYYYLCNAFRQVEEEKIDTVITGSSYGLFGIDDKMLKNQVNLSLASQDLYFSIKSVYRAFEKNDEISNVVLCVGYYYFYTDLSKTQNEYEIMRLPKVYDLLYGDVHNGILFPEKKTFLMKSHIFDIDIIMETFAEEEYKKGYFNSGRHRKDYATKLWKNQKKMWTELNLEEKLEAAEKRGQQHNRLINRKASYVENVAIFKEFLKFCVLKKINIMIVVTPVTSHYRTFFDKRYKEGFYAILNSMEEPIHLLDCSDSPYFDDADFNDTDHLNHFGAKKMTSIILETLYKINRSKN